MSARMMIEFLGEKEASAHLEKAIAKFTETQPLTMSTTETTEKFMEILASID